MHRNHKKELCQGNGGQRNKAEQKFYRERSELSRRGQWGRKGSSRRGAEGAETGGLFFDRMDPPSPRLWRTGQDFLDGK
jgi:hypothetical protein